MTLFACLAALLVVAVTARLLLPLLRASHTAANRSGVANDRREANLAIFRDQLADLEREHQEHLLSDADLEQSKRELQRRLLEDVESEGITSAVNSGSPASRSTAIALFIVLPLAAAAGYALLGNPRALDPMQTQPQARVTPEQVEAMVGKLAAKLQQNPDDANGWVMLARSYKTLGRFPEAADAYSHAGTIVDKDAVLLADYAEILAQINNGNLQGKPSELLARALKLDPDEPQALLLAGAAASDRRDFAAAAGHWSRLLSLLDPDSEESEALKNAVSKARELAAQRPDTGKPPKAGAAVESISGQVTLSPQLSAQVKPDDVLFVFARAEDGQRMPLAVVRSTAGNLPLRFNFDDSMALPGGRMLSEFKTVSIEARIAKAGKAQSSSGDLFGNINGIKPGKQGINLTIDRVQP
jgi:cytochrome c-type biogenesis protein CcmH